MNHSSSKTHNQKCPSAALPEQPTKTQRRKKQQHHQPSFRRNPLQDLNNGGIDSSSIDNSSNASSLSSIEAPKGCLRNEVGDSKISSFLESSGSLVNNKLKSGPGELKKVLIDGVCEGSGANFDSFV
ncbi:hypothetical protein OIU79_001350 [Salix purpurea]|uniref:Uncharacterized protein n=1 Tax=Salix purpurea TaxID=77065 RepID=A0A9Q0ZH04_SALPP|nr:hypothetical protein OIU79_001350 [Salix purpurea]